VNLFYVNVRAPKRLLHPIAMLARRTGRGEDRRLHCNRPKTRPAYVPAVGCSGWEREPGTDFPADFEV